MLTLSVTTGSAVRGAVLAFVYGLGIGIPFLVVAAVFQRGVRLFPFARRRALLMATAALALAACGGQAVSGAQGSLVGGTPFAGRRSGRPLTAVRRRRCRAPR